MTRDPEVGDIVYRMEDRTYAQGGYDFTGSWESSPFGPGVRVKMLEFTVIRVTPCGFWFIPGTPTDTMRSGSGQWRSFGTRYVCCTRAEAAQEAMRRRAYHLMKSEQRLALVQRRLREVKYHAAGFLVPTCYAVEGGTTMVNGPWAFPGDRTAVEASIMRDLLHKGQCATTWQAQALARASTVLFLDRSTKKEIAEENEGRN